MAIYSGVFPLKMVDLSIAMLVYQRVMEYDMIWFNAVDIIIGLV